MNQIEIVREACVKANPAILLGEDEAHQGPYYRPIRLADVLLAMKLQEDREFAYQVKLIVGGAYNTMWNLRKDDLPQQTPETLAFLADLLKEKDV